MTLKHLFSIILSAISITVSAQEANNDALLFHLSAENGTTADYAKGKNTPNFLTQISTIDDGVVGKALRCGNKQTLSWWAPGNIYADRGTLSFFWRSSEPLYATEFPLFRVSFADHSSWDMTWLRIDYNGHGFDAFVTDNHLARVRVSTKVDIDPYAWYHLALTWDENQGIRFFVNGELAARKDSVTVLDTGLDQFGPHSRIISPYKVQSMYNMQRGGDVDELRIYSKPLSDKEIAMLAKAESPEVSSERLSLADARIKDEWNHRYGFDKQLPPYLKAASTTIRKVGILEAYDLKRWYWKANDGILETTWPGVYNRSRLPGRNDYFQLPDWDCYFDSGKNVRFNMPDEEWNYVEVTGGAYGELGVSEKKDGSSSRSLSSISKSTHRSFHMLNESIKGKTLTFTNVEKEEPIQELNAYNVFEGEAPKGVARLQYMLRDFNNMMDRELMDVEDYVAGRNVPQARRMLLALPGTSGQKLVSADTAEMLPVVHIVIPSDTRDFGRDIPVEIGMPRLISASRNASWANMRGGLDGVLLEIPAMNCKAKDGLIPLNIQIKDPIWKLRNMIDVSVSVKPGEARTLWLDLRDRILPNDKPLYMTIASGSSDFSAASLSDAKITLVFKNLEEARAEHIADRLTQVRDTYAMTCEENTASKRYPKFQQLWGDMDDLFRVDPNNKIGRSYWALFYGEQVPLDYTEPVTPNGIPEWAFMQLELMKKYRDLANYYMDERQIENGEFGGGISDDTDFVNTFPAFHAMGLQPEKTRNSVRRLLEAVYDQGMLTNGISTIQTDGLHTYEEGVNTLDQANIIEQGDPILAERLMETAKSLRDILYGVNEAGHTHMRSDFFGASKIATEGVWVWSTNRSYFHTAPALLLGQMYGNTGAREYVMKFIDSMLAHARINQNGLMEMPEDVNFLTDEVRSWGWNNSMPPLFYAWKWTGDSKYMKPVEDSKWIMNVGSKEEQARQYRSILRDLCNREYVMTEGSIWIDRVNFPPDVVQTARIGAPAMNRLSHYVPTNAVRWKFENDRSAETVAIWISEHSDESLKINFFNTEKKSVKVRLTGAEAMIGDWELDRGNGRKEIVRFGRSRSIDLTIPAGKDWTVSLRLVSRRTDTSEYTDLAVSDKDAVISGNTVKVTLHNISGKDAQPMEIALVDSKGRIISSVMSPEIKAPLDLTPKTAEIKLNLPASFKPGAYSIVVDPNNAVEELYETNNVIRL